MKTPPHSRITYSKLQNEKDLVHVMLIDSTSSSDLGTIHTFEGKLLRTKYKYRIL